MGKRTLFGTDGIRGKANLYPMTCEMALALGRAVTNYFQQSGSSRPPRIIIGKDTRLSCYMLEQAFASGVCSQGGRAIFTGPLPTPGVAFVTTSMKADAGVMISASHNTFSDNGIKIFDRTGHKLPDSVEQELESMVLDPTQIPIKIGAELGSAKRFDEVIGRYIVSVKASLDNGCNLEGLRLVVDCANGAGYKVAPMIFEELGADVIALGISPNGQNINAHCGALYPEDCAEKVIKYRADLGICLDGDADRLRLVDGNGKIIPGDKVIGLCAKFLKDKGELGKKPEILGTVMTNIGLERYLQKQGIKLTRTKVGDRYIVEKMRTSGLLFGGESSGHIIFKKHSTTGDGILAALKVLECIKYYDKSLDELIEEITLFPQVQASVKATSKTDFKKNANISRSLQQVEQALGKAGRVVLRYSGTEPLARIMVEGEDEGKVTELCHSLKDVVAKEIGAEA